VASSPLHRPIGAPITACSQGAERVWEHAVVAASERVQEIETPSGPARAHLTQPRIRPPRGLLVLGHGAGGGVDAPDQLAVTAALSSAGWSVARVEQPYRVKGHRAPEAAPRLDAAWIAVVRALRARRRGPIVVGGRSSGARVACRTASEVGAAAVVALAFPLHPPGKPEKSRLDELVAVTMPTLVVQGDRDAFGTAGELPAGPTVVSVRGDHSLRQAPADVAAAVSDWLSGIGL
jgi:predicted alpha/beta-hydrolase family hydrolase